jgi:hypothetical protein
MENERALIVVLVLIGLVLGANFVMVAFVRGFVRHGKKGFLETLGNSLRLPSQMKDGPMDELHRRVRDLGQGKKELSDDS